MDLNTAMQIMLLIAAFLFSIGFLVLVISAIIFFRRLKPLIGQIEKLSAEITELVREVKNISTSVQGKLNKIDGIIDTSVNAVRIVQNAASFVSNGVVSKTAGALALLPAVKEGWKQIKDMIGGKKKWQAKTME